MLTFLLLTNLFACIEPPPTATEGGTEPSGAAKPEHPSQGRVRLPLPTPPVRANWTTLQTPPQSLNRTMGALRAHRSRSSHRMPSRTASP